MHDLVRPFVPHPRLARRFALALATVIGLLFAVGSLSVAWGQQPEVTITELQCNTDPEVVTISNGGSTEQDLTGWTLRSDPVASEVFDLSAVGTLGPGVSIFVQAGPAASGTFVWSQTFVLRDSDPADFARIVDNTGAVIHEVKCQSASPTTATATRTAAPTLAPTAAPTAAPADGVPIGGGPPGGGSWHTAGLLLIAGSWILALTMGALLVLRLRQSANPAFAVSSSARPLATPPAHSENHGQLAYLLLVLVLTVLAALSLRDDNRRRPGQS